MQHKSPTPPCLTDIYTPVGRSFWLSPRSVICVQTSTLPHSRLQHFPFPSHSLPASTLPLGGLEPPHPCPLGCRRKLYTNSIRQVIAILAHPRVRGTVKRRRGVFLRTVSNWQKVTSACLSRKYIRPYINNIYSARVPMHSRLSGGTSSCSPMLDQALLE